jgi:PKD repeat protein
MKKYLVFIILSSLFGAALSQTRPNLIPDLVLWLRADSNVVLNGSTVAQWNDCSMNNNNATQSVSALQPLLVNNNLNGLPVVSFDGINDYFNGTTIPNINNSSLSIVVVANGATYVGPYISPFFGVNCYSNQFGFCRSGQNQSLLLTNTVQYTYGLMSSSGSLPNSGFPYSILECTKDFNVVSKIYINGDSLNSSTDATQTGTFLNGNYYIGEGNGGCYLDYYNGDIAEIIIYNQALSATDRQSVEKYLHDKYAPPVNLGPDINIHYGFCDTVIRAGKNFSSYLWSPSGATSDSIIVSKTGYYSVSVTDIFGDTSIDSIHVQYQPTIFLNDTFFCQGDSVLLAPNDSGSYTYLWSNNATTPAIYAKSAGKYWLVITDTNHCTTDTIKVNITEDTYPSLVSLGSDTSSFCAGNSISLASGAAQTIYYLWSTSVSTPSIVVNTTGNYSVTGTDAGGCKGSDSTYVKITGIAPVVGFLSSRGCSSDSISFADTSTVIFPSVIASWNWNFGDGLTSNRQNPKHKFLPGYYTVKDSVVSSSGCSNTLTKLIHINASPVAAFAVDTACAGHNYTFVDSSASSEGNIISWYWDFGDGSHSYAKDTIHKYSTFGTYFVTLTITTDSGCTAVATHQIAVVGSAHSPGPFTLYLPSDSLVTTNHIINFAWNIAPNAVSYTLQYSPDPLFAIGVTRIHNIATTSIQQTISVLQKYYWRVIAYGICGDSLISNIFNFTVFNNSSIAGMQLWLKADSALALINDSLVTQWNDCSGSGNNAASSGQPAKRDSIKYLNYKSIINFNAADNQFFTGSIIANLNNSSLTIFVVANGATYVGPYVSPFFGVNCYSNQFGFCRSGQNQSLLLTNTGQFTYGLMSSSGSLPNSGFPYSILECTKDFNVVSKIYINGDSLNSSIDAAQTGTFLNGNYYIGEGNGGCYLDYYNGDIAEIIIYNQALSATDRQSVEKYLHDKYAPPVNLGPDIWSTNFCDTTLDASPRFVNYLWNTGETTSSIHVDTSGKYWVSVTDIFGFTSSDTVLVHKPFITTHDTLACFGSSVTLHAGLGAPYTFHWFPGDSTTESITVTSPDTVNLKVYGPDSCFVNRQIIVRADSFKLIASLGKADTNMCQGDLIGLVSGSSTAQSYQWNDGTTNSMHSILWTAGTHPVYLTVTDINGCQSIDSIKVKVIGVKPSAAFTSDSVCQGTLTQLVGDTICNCGGAVIDNFQWSFGDDSTGAGQKPSHLYQKYGIFPVTMTVKTTAGCIASVTEPACVFSNPVANFIPLIGCEGVPLKFQDKSTNAFGNISSWYWNFGDPVSGLLNTSTFEDPSHTYHAVSTTEIVELIVTTQYGCKDTADKAVTIREAPDVGFKYTSVCDGNPVYFTDTSTTPITNQIIKWDWHFSITDSSTIQNPVYLFNAGGTYPVWLTVKAVNGC